jgi:DNA-binding CsgD family transcriptional regulator
VRSPEGYHQSRTGRWQPSERQRLVLDAVTENKTNAEIAALLGITLNGAKWHVGELLGKTGLRDRQELASWWLTQRERRASLLFAPLALRLSLLSLGLGVVAVAGILLVGGFSGDGTAKNVTDPMPVFGLDLPESSPRMMPIPPAPDAYFSCPVTLPNGSDPPGERPGRHFGNGAIWSSAGDDGRSVLLASELNPDGSLSLKWVWWTNLPVGTFSMEATRLDGPGSFVSGDFNPGIAGGGTPVWVGGPTFSQPGCWRITAHLDGQSLTIVSFLQVTP